MCVHILPWALVACLIAVGVELLVLTALSGRSVAVNIAALVAVPILSVLLFVVAISGFMFTTELRWTAVTCAPDRDRGGARRRAAGQADRHGKHGGRN